jgi:dTDP-4-amino-4,6-dideoxygalactose transaminase
MYDIRIDAATRRRVDAVLRSGWLTTGPVTARFEKAIAAKVRVRHAVALSSNTAGLELCLRALGIGAGREVVTSPFTFVATAEAILNAGAQPVFADINPHTLTVDPEEVARKVTDRTGALMTVDIAGYPCDYALIKRIADHFSFPLIADAAHSLGARFKRKTVAGWCDAAVHSFHATKNLTCAEGGMLVSRHKVLADRVRLLSLHGLTSTAYQRKRAGNWHYDVLEPGMKANMTDVSAAIGLGQLDIFEKNQERRRKIADRYATNLAHLSDFLETPAAAKGVEHAWHLYIVRLVLDRLKIDRDRLIRLMRRRGVECGVHYMPLFVFSLFNRLGIDPRHFPNTLYAASRVVSLPMYPHLALADVDRVCEALESLCRRYRA